MPRGKPKSGKRNMKKKMTSQAKAQTVSKSTIPKRVLSGVAATRKALDKLEQFINSQQGFSGRQGATAAGHAMPVTGKRKGRKPKTQEQGL